MHDQEAIEMMGRCSNEIKMLRQQVASLAPKAAAYDVLALTINTMAPRQSVGMGEDVAWMLDNKIAKIKEAIELEKTKQPAPETPNQ